MSVGRKPLSASQSAPFLAYFSDHEVLPPGQCGWAAGLVSPTVDEVAFGIEVVVEGSVNRGELV